MGDKLPEHLRPPMKELLDQVSQIIPKKLERLFVIDLQNDCACNTEIYELDAGHRLCYTDTEGNPFINVECGKTSCNLPMFPKLNFNNIEDTIRYGLSLATDKRPCCDIGMASKVARTNEDWLSPTSIIIDKRLHKNGWYKNVYAMDLPDELSDSIFILPDPEYLGVISANLFGMGFFFIAEHIMRVSLTDEIKELWTKYY